MQKIKSALLAFGLIVAIIGLGLGVKEVSAQYCAGDWNCVCDSWDDANNVCGVPWDCTCNTDTDFVCNCDSGEVCDRFGGCHPYDSGGSSGGSRYVGVDCPAGQTAVGGVVLAPLSRGFDCMTRAMCDSWHPSAPNPNGADPDSCPNAATRTDCILGSLCCPTGPDSVVQCGNIISANDILATDVNYWGYTNCPSGYRVAVYNGETPSVYCRDGCRCATCPAANRTCSLRNLGYNSVKIVNSASINYCNVDWLDGTDDDDRFISNVPYQCTTVTTRVCEGEDGGPPCGQAPVTTCTYKLTCEKRATICNCSVPCPITTDPSGLSFNQSTGVLSWSGATADTSSTIRVYISSTSQASVTGFCASGCLPGMPLVFGPSTGSVNIASLLSPSTQYWAVVRSYKDDSCNRTSAPYTWTTPSANTTPWWQVTSGDVHAGDNTGGIIRSLIPTGVAERVLIRNNSAGFSGVASTQAQGAGAIDLGSGGGSASNPANWRATGAPFLGTAEGYSYSYFERKIPDGCTPQNITTTSVDLSTGGTTGGSCGEYYWFRYQGVTPLSINASASLGSKKVILFVKGSATIDSDINFTDGVGAFYLFAEGDVNVDETVGDAAVAVASATPDIEGILFAQGTIATGTVGSATDLQLFVRGGVVGLGGVTLQRNLSNNNFFPGDYFEFGPDLVLSWPISLTRRNLIWQEVAP